MKAATATTVEGYTISPSPIRSRTGNDQTTNDQIKRRISIPEIRNHQHHVQRHGTVSTSGISNDRSLISSRLYYPNTDFPPLVNTSTNC